MTDEIENLTLHTKELSFDKTKNIPQKINMKYKGEIFELYYTLNTFSSTIVLKIKKTSNREVIFKDRLLKNNVYVVRDFDNPYISFLIYVNEVTLNEVKAYIFDEDTKVFET